MIISLHFLGFRTIPRSFAKSDIWFTTIGRKLGEQRRITSMAVVSSTNFTLPGQSLSKELTSTANSSGPNLVPCRRPPFIFFHAEYEFSIRTHCSLLLSNALIHLTITGWTSRLSSSRSMTLWSTRSNPFLKSAKNNLSEQLPI